MTVNNKVLFYSTGKNIQYHVINSNGKEFLKMTEVNPNLTVNTINVIALNSKLKGQDSQTSFKNPTI